MAKARAPRRIAILAYPGVQSLDVTGPLEVFAGAQTLLAGSVSGERGYEVQVLSRDGEPLRTSSGLTIVPHGKLEQAPTRLDTLIVAGGYGSWGASAAELARRYPAVEVDPEPIFIRDGAVWTSAGVTAGMDLALALVEEDLGRDTALTIARHLVLFLRRPGNQSQFSATLAAQRAEREPLRDVQRAVLEDVAGDHSVEAMAARAHMSPRHFARAFRAETGVTPARHVERVRLEAARRELEDTDDPIGAIAAACGFATAEIMRRAFLRTLHVGPAEYRRRFQAPTSEETAA